jgi:hypothetical protein
MKHGDDMSYIEEFNHRLNKSIVETPKSDHHYVDQVATALRSILRSKAVWDRACIIGAGRCRDIPTMLFLDHFKEIIVTDVDVTSLKECTKNRRNLSIQQVEYTGFQEAHFFERFGETMWQATTKEDVDRFLDDTRSRVQNYRFLEHEKESMEFVFVSPIYTQLIVQQAMHELHGLVQDGYDPQLAAYMQERLLVEMSSIIERFNDNVIYLLKEEGILFVLSDVFELQTNSEFYRRVTNSIKNQDVMNEIYENYNNTYGFGLGDYGVYDLTTKLDVIRDRWLLWNFSNTRSFAIHLYIYNKNKGGTQ